MAVLARLCVSSWGVTPSGQLVGQAGVSGVCVVAVVELVIEERRRPLANTNSTEDNF